jgi:hypothetical protein
VASSLEMRSAAPLKSWRISSRYVDSMETFMSGCEKQIN